MNTENLIFKNSLRWYERNVHSDVESTKDGGMGTTSVPPPLIGRGLVYSLTHSQALGKKVVVHNMDASISKSFNPLRREKRRMLKALTSTIQG